VQLVSKISNLCGPDPPTLRADRQTDRQTDRRTPCDRKITLCTVVHRAVTKALTSYSVQLRSKGIVYILNILSSDFTNAFINRTLFNIIRHTLRLFQMWCEIIVNA